MAKRITDVVLKEGAHEVSFIEGITKLPEVELKDRVETQFFIFIYHNGNVIIF